MFRSLIVAGIAAMPEWLQYGGADAAAGSSGDDQVFSRCGYVTNNFCLASDGGVDILGARNVDGQVLGAWSFDSVYPVDDSHKGMNLHPPLPAGPDRLGRSNGGSLWLQKSDGTGLSSQPGKIDSKALDATMSLWIFPEPPSSAGVYGTIASIGDSLAIALVATTQRSYTLQVLTEPDSSCSLVKDSLISRGLIPFARWTHVGVVMDSSIHKMSLYINGIADNSAPLTFSGLTGVATFGKGTSRCPQMTGFIDDAKIFGSALSPSRLGALVSPKLISSALHALVKVGDLQVPQSQAENFCDGAVWVLCDKQDIEDLQLRERLRVQGYLALVANQQVANPHLPEDERNRLLIWNKAAVATGANITATADLLGMATCCRPRDAPTMVCPSPTSTTTTAAD